MRAFCNRQGRTEEPAAGLVRLAGIEPAAFRSGAAQMVVPDAPVLSLTGPPRLEGGSGCLPSGDRGYL